MVNEPADHQGHAESPPKKFHVSFFSPKTPHAKANMTMIIIMVLVWGFGVFGFQGLLIALGKPVAEPVLAEFDAVWPTAFESQAVDNSGKQQLCRALLKVLGKNIAVVDADKVMLKSALTATLHGMVTETQRAALDEAATFLINITPETPEEEIIAKQTQIERISSEAIGLSGDGFDKLMTDLLPASILQSTDVQEAEAVTASLPALMKKYLTHNRCALTDTVFMGFPFHYWYTAQFLLIMFVVLCLIYAIMTDRIHKKYGYAEE